MKRIVSATLVCLFTALSLFSQTPSALNIAVNDLTGKGLEQSSASIISDRLRSELINTGAFRVMERNEMDKILKEQGFQKTGACDQASCLVEVGQLLGVERIVAGTVGKIGTLYTLSLRMINVATGQIMFTVDEDYEGDIKGLLSGSVGTAAKKLAVGAGGEIKKASFSGKVGDLYITSTPTGAAIELDGKALTGETPVTLKGIAAGDHRVAARKAEYYGSQTVSIAPDDLVKVNLILEEGTGALKVFTSPDAAEVLIDDKNVGTTPLKLGNLAVGEHRMRIAKHGYFTEESTVRINSSDVNNINVTLKPAASISVKSRPKTARIMVNGEEAGVGEIKKYQVGSGTVVISAELSGYEAATTTFVLAQGEHKELGEWVLSSVFGALTVESEPAGALVYLNDLSVGKAPYTNALLTPDNYRLKIAMATYNDYLENISIVKNTLYNREIVLSHTQTYIDSMKAVEQIKYKQNQLVRRILFGAGAAIAGGAGIYCNTLAQAHIEKQHQLQADYQNASIGFSDYQAWYTAEKQSAEQDALARNFLYVIGGVLAAGLVISIPF